MMKIKYQISETSRLEPQVIMDKALIQLNAQHYIIENKADNIISFKDDNWQIRSKGTGFRKVDKGSFEITPLNEGSLIRYTYYVSFLPETVITTILVILSFTQSYFIILIDLPFLIQLGVRIYTLKDVSKQMIKRLAN
ncbi:MAG TPA: hypothetical protein VK671_00425 [Mucilaginibacter sp.]|jgi:hypothetical protein|nr:hypothetical protein [Mucilaginibacter sp.]